MHQHVRRLDADPDDPRNQANHGVRPLLGSMFQPFQARRLDRLDLLPQQGQPRQIAPQLGEGVQRQRLTLRGDQLFKTFRGLTKFRVEPANAQSNQGALHPVDDPGQGNRVKKCVTSR